MWRAWRDLVPFLLAGCAAASSVSTPRPITTFNVTNETGLTVNFYLEGIKIGSITGPRGCLKVRQSAVGGGTNGRLVIKVTSEDPVVSPIIDLRRAWAISISPSPSMRHLDLLSLRPATRCDGERDDTEAYRPGDQPTP